MISENSWFYAQDGQRNGPISETELISIIKSKKLSYGSSVWRKGFSDWMKLENTELRIHLEEAGVPPPLSSDHVSNTIIWVLAFAPILGMLLEFIAAIAYYYPKYQYAYMVFVEDGMQEREFWFVTLVLNLALCYWDEKRLKNAGYSTDKFKGWIWLVPVYIFQRAKFLNNNIAYFVVWVVCFALTLMV